MRKKKIKVLMAIALLAMLVIWVTLGAPSDDSKIWLPGPLDETTSFTTKR